MQPNVLFAGNPDDWPMYRTTLTASLARQRIAANLSNHFDDPALVDYIVYAPNHGLEDFTPYTRLKAVLSLWAGVESFQHNTTLRVPLARMVDAGLSEGMSEWVLGHVMRYHLGMDEHLLNQDGVWRNDITPPLARNRTVGILGLGELGLFAAQSLRSAGFNVCGWSRRQKSEPGIDCHSGDGGLDQVLSMSDILVLLLPLTPATENILNEETLARLPNGAFVLNPGRGLLIDDTALLAALEKGQISHATLDVFRIEPLPKIHPFWAHPSVTVTPHIASETRPETASDTIAENIRLGEENQPLRHLVNRREGY